MPKKYINFQFEILDAPFLEGGKPIKNQDDEVRQFAQWLGWKAVAPDQFAPEYCPFVIIPAGTKEEEAQAIAANCASRSQGCIRAEMLSDGDEKVIEAENARRKAGYEMACQIAENPAFAIEDASAAHISQAYFNARLQNVPPALHSTFSKQFQEEYEIA